MTTTALAIAYDLKTFLIPADVDKHTRARLALFCKWQSERGKVWHDLDLKAYRDHLQSYRGFSPATVSAHLSAVRSRYRNLMTDNTLRAQWLNRLGEDLRRIGQDDSPANRRALLDEYYTRLTNAIDPSVAPVKHIVVQDRPDAAHVRLTQAQAEAMMHAPGTDTLLALRDTAVIALMLCTGLREAELCALQVGDLRQKLGDKLALHVRQGKGMKERLIPYGDLVWVLAIVDRWLGRANIRSGKVLRAFWKGNEKIRGDLSVRAVENIVKRYPVTNAEGKAIVVRPHDLRRTYAKRQYETGLDLLSISQNLGHGDTKTTLLYIGDLSADQRQAKLAYSYDLSRLK
jgi:site-specific recombinase XerD